MKQIIAIDMPYFDSGNRPLLSVLLPSRSRFDMLCYKNSAALIEQHKSLLL